MRIRDIEEENFGTRSMKSHRQDGLAKVRELLNYHKSIAAEEGTSVNGIELAEDLEALLDDALNKSNMLTSGINETSSSQYEVMLDRAGELGEHIASNVLLDDHTESWGIGADRSGPKEVTTIVNKHMTVAIKRMKDTAYKYIQRRLRKD